MYVLNAADGCIPSDMATGTPAADRRGAAPALRRDDAGARPPATWCIRCASSRASSSRRRPPRLRAAHALHSGDAVRVVRASGAWRAAAGRPARWHARGGGGCSGAAQGDVALAMAENWGGGCVEEPHHGRLTGSGRARSRPIEWSFRLTSEYDRPSCRTPRSPRRPLHVERELGRGRDGHRLPRPRPEARSPGRHQGAAPRARREPGRRAVPARDQDRRPAEPPPHPAAVRLRRGRRPPVLRHAVRGGRVAARAARRAKQQLPLEEALRDHPRSGRRAGATPTARTSCTATSSPRTSCFRQGDAVVARLRHRRGRSARPAATALDRDRDQRRHAGAT